MSVQTPTATVFDPNFDNTQRWTDITTVPPSEPSIRPAVLLDSQSNQAPVEESVNDASINPASRQNKRRPPTGFEAYMLNAMQYPDQIAAKYGREFSQLVEQNKGLLLGLFSVDFTNQNRSRDGALALQYRGRFTYSQRKVVEKAVEWEKRESFVLSAPMREHTFAGIQSDCKRCLIVEYDPSNKAKPFMVQPVRRFYDADGGRNSMSLSFITTTIRPTDGAKYQPDPEFDTIYAALRHLVSNANAKESLHIGLTKQQRRNRNRSRSQGAQSEAGDSEANPRSRHVSQSPALKGTISRSKKNRQKQRAKKGKKPESDSGTSLTDVHVEVSTNSNGTKQLPQRERKGRSNTRSNGKEASRANSRQSASRNRGDGNRERSASRKSRKNSKSQTRSGNNQPVQSPRAPPKR